MSFSDFKNSRILRNPTTWIVAVMAAVYGGVEMYGIREAKRAAGEELTFPTLGLERTVDFLFGATCEVGFFLCAVWGVAGLMENANVWLRQLTVVVLYLLITWLARVL